MEAWCEAVLVVVVVVVVVVVTVVVTVVVVVGVSVTSRPDRNSRQALKMAPTDGAFEQVWLPPPMQLQPLRYLPAAPQQVQLHNRNLPVRFIEFGIARATKRLRSEFPTSEQCSETFG